MFNDLMIDELARARLTDLYRQAAEERLARTVARSRTPSRVRGLLRRACSVVLWMANWILYRRMVAIVPVCSSD